MDIVKPVTFALVSANIINFVGNWVLIYGHWGAPALGLEGTGYATSLSRLYMAAVVFGAVWEERKSRYLLFAVSWRPDWSRAAAS